MCRFVALPSDWAIQWLRCPTKLETPDGIKLTAYDPTLAEQMAVAEQVMAKRRNLLRKLAQGEFAQWLRDHITVEKNGEVQEAKARYR